MPILDVDKAQNVVVMKRGRVAVAHGDELLEIGRAHV